MTSSNDSQKPCGNNKHNKEHKYPVAGLGLDATERTILEIVRLYCMSYAAPESQGWEIALEISSGKFGDEVGGKIAVATMRILKELRKTRRTNFKFSNPTCPCCREGLTDNELRLMRIIKMQRSGMRNFMQTDTMLLCEGADAGSFMFRLDVMISFVGSRASHSAKQSLPPKTLKKSGIGKFLLN